MLLHRIKEEIAHLIILYPCVYRHFYKRYQAHIFIINGKIVEIILEEKKENGWEKSNMDLKAEVDRFRYEEEIIFSLENFGKYKSIDMVDCEDK